MIFLQIRVHYGDGRAMDRLYCTRLMLNTALSELLLLPHVTRDADPATKIVSTSLLGVQVCEEDVSNDSLSRLDVDCVEDVVTRLSRLATARDKVA